MKEFKNAILHTSKVLEIESDNVKALYRRAMSYKYLQEVFKLKFLIDIYF